MSTSLEHELSTPVYAQFFLHWLLLWESAVKKIIPFKLFTCIQYDIRGSIKIAIKFILTSIKLQNNHDKMDLNKNLPGERQEEKIVFTFLILLLVSFCVSVLKSCRCVRTAVSPQWYPSWQQSPPGKLLNGLSRLSSEIFFLRNYGRKIIKAVTCLGLGETLPATPFLWDGVEPLKPCSKSPRHLSPSPVQQRCAQHGLGLTATVGDTNVTGCSWGEVHPKVSAGQQLGENHRIFWASRDSQLSKAQLLALQRTASSITPRAWQRKWTLCK